MSIRRCSSRPEASDRVAGPAAGLPGAAARGAADGAGPLPLRVLHADESWIVIDKPAGLPSVPGRTPQLQDCVARRAAALYADALVAHRLDMATSGLMLMARGVDNRRRLGLAFEQRRVAKTYVALVAGTPQDDAGEIDLPLAADWPRRPLQIVDRQRGKPALTRWRVIERLGPLTRVQLEPLSGRTHQLRVHLSAIGHPIVGDALYAPDAAQGATTRLMLHASRLGLAHPQTRQHSVFVSPATF